MICNVPCWAASSHFVWAAQDLSFSQHYWFVIVTIIVIVIVIVIVEKNISWTLKLLFCINFIIKKPCLKFPKSST